ncbi:MAG: hypothetical protein ABI588_06395 [Arenimonas sp.]
MKRVWLQAVAVALLAGCGGTVKQVHLDSTTMVGAQLASSNRCQFRLKDVIDARAQGGEAGGLGWNQLRVADGPALLRGELLKAGLLPAGAQGRDVVVNLKQMYMTQNRTTKVPVVVYQVQADGLAPFLVRAQPTRMNWNSSDDEALSGLSRALHEANSQLMSVLQKSCGA